NVISITDGQIFLESELFHSGQRPAINVGVSVSRVGGDAQIKAMKKIASPLRVNLAQYRELAVFAQFGSDLDKSTMEKLMQGERLYETLKQNQYSPLQVEVQVVLLFAVINGYLMDIDVKEVKKFNVELIDYIKDKYDDIFKSIRDEKQIKPETEKLLRKAIAEYKVSRS
ncbi:MAG: F0F1 ATP synthase subunit alpha, partial [Oscillospiraceae bacterium]